MKKSIATLTILCASATVMGVMQPAIAQTGQSAVGPSVAFGSGSTVFGIDSKFGVADSISIRPAIYFGSGNTLFGSAVTYDFNLKGSGGGNKITPFVGGSLLFGSNSGSSSVFSILGGADFDVSDNIQLKGAVNVPISNNGNGSTFVTIGAGFKF
jgi:opacity protein-like surface antigen